MESPTLSSRQRAPAPTRRSSRFKSIFLMSELKRNIVPYANSLGTSVTVRLFNVVALGEIMASTQDLNVFRVFRGTTLRVRNDMVEMKPGIPSTFRPYHSLLEGWFLERPEKH